MWPRRKVGIKPGFGLDFYNQRRKQLKEVEPNLGHLILAELETDLSVHNHTKCG
jgi:NAD-dependent SIR2 family protein deacetylase